MNNSLTLDTIITSIKERAKQKYVIRTEGPDIVNWMAIELGEVIERTVLRLKRETNRSENWKTIVISIVTEPALFQTAFKWVATIKDELLDPETADLYFIGVVSSSDISLEFCTNIETKEQFCRKYILRPGEDVNDLIGRTFLSTLDENIISTDIVDPLHTAIQQTGARISSFSAYQQGHWRSALISGSTGAELIDDLFRELPNNPNQNETSSEDNTQ